MTQRRRNRRRRTPRFGWLLAAALVACAAWGVANWRDSRATDESQVTPVARQQEPPDPRALATLALHPVIELNASLPEHGSIVVLRRRLHYVRGGTLTSIRARMRYPVATLIKEAGGIAGLNGTFFGDPRVAGTGNKMIGPILDEYSGEFVPPDPPDVPRCLGRPLVIWGGGSMAIVPFEEWMGNDVASLQSFVPDAANAFLGGGWLVREGVAKTEDEIRLECVKDAQDFRRRAFVGVDDSGRVVLGATDFSVDSARLARALEELSIREAVLLDSGFSTSLVWEGRTLVSGHSRPSHPSRPVPHALIIHRLASAAPDSLKGTR